MVLDAPKEMDDEKDIVFLQGICLSEEKPKLIGPGYEPRMRGLLYKDIVLPMSDTVGRSKKKSGPETL